METILGRLAALLIFGFEVLAALAPMLLLGRVRSMRQFGIVCLTSSWILVVSGFAWIGFGAMDGTLFVQRFMYALWEETNFGALLWGAVGVVVLIIDGVGRFVSSSHTVRM